MISKKLRNIFLLSIILFYLHGVEEVLTGFYHVDPIIYWIAQRFQTIPQAVYWVLHSEWWLMLVAVYFLLVGGKWAYRVMVFYGLILIFECHHLVEAVIRHHYFPGMITALFFPIITYYFWKELILQREAA